MKSFFLSRILGMILIVVGAVLTFGILWLVQIMEMFTVRLVVLGPLVGSLGVGLLICGDSILPKGDDDKPGFLFWLFAIPGAIGGWYLTEGLKNGDLHLLEMGKEMAAEKAGLREHLVTRDELDAAIKDVTTRAGELQKIRATLKASDPVAMEKFNKDVADYNQRNRAAADLKAKYEARLAREAQLKAKLMGTWKYEFAVSKGWTTKNTVSGYATYSPDGRAHIDATVTTDTKQYHPISNGHWELEGDHFRVIVDSVNEDCAEKPGDIRDYLIQEVTETEFHYRDMKDGAELVRYRVKM